MTDESGDENLHAHIFIEDEGPEQQDSKTPKAVYGVGTYSDFEGVSCLTNTLVGVDNTVHLSPGAP